MAIAYCFGATLPNRKYPCSTGNNVESSLSAIGIYQFMRIPVRRCACMCRKESNTEPHIPRQREEPERRNTPESFTEPAVKSDALRNTDFAFILTLLVTAVAGGPIITAWSALYFLVGRQNDVPLWLCSLASLICSALTDAFIWNFSDANHGSGLIPYLIFALGTGTSAVLDFDEFFRVALPSALRTDGLKQGDGGLESGTHEQSQQATNDLNAWDQVFREKLSDQE